jgi:hypothetical protein
MDIFSTNNGVFHIMYSVTMLCVHGNTLAAIKPLRLSTKCQSDSLEGTGMDQ